MTADVVSAAERAATGHQRFLFSSAPQARSYHSLAGEPGWTSCGQPINPFRAVVSATRPTRLAPCRKCFRARVGRGVPQRDAAATTLLQFLNAVASGAQVKDAAAALGIGLRTASRYLTDTSAALGATTHLHLGFLLGLNAAQPPQGGTDAETVRRVVAACGEELESYFADVPFIDGAFVAQQVTERLATRNGPVAHLAPVARHGQGEE